jgi:hypothetical protein
MGKTHKQLSHKFLSMSLEKPSEFLKQVNKGTMSFRKSTQFKI